MNETSSKAVPVFVIINVFSTIIEYLYFYFRRDRSLIERLKQKDKFYVIDSLRITLNHLVIVSQSLFDLF